MKTCFSSPGTAEMPGHPTCSSLVPQRDSRTRVSSSPLFQMAQVVVKGTVDIWLGSSLSQTGDYTSLHWETSHRETLVQCLR